MSRVIGHRVNPGGTEYHFQADFGQSFYSSGVAADQAPEIAKYWTTLFMGRDNGGNQKHAEVVGLNTREQECQCIITYFDTFRGKVNFLLLFFKTFHILLFS